MIGVFDSGVGGFTALPTLRAACPAADILYLADRAHAPYGTREPAELTALVRADVAYLHARGASPILVACGTASTVLSTLPAQERRDCLSLLSPALEAAHRLSRRGRIGLLATEATVKSAALTQLLAVRHPESRLYPIAAQPLVALVEAGARDGHISPDAQRTLCNLLAPLLPGAGAATDGTADTPAIDTLILGCTHFSHLQATIEALLPGVRTVSAAREGALTLLTQYPSCRRLREGGRTIYTEGR